MPKLIASVFDGKYPIQTRLIEFKEKIVRVASPTQADYRNAKFLENLLIVPGFVDIHFHGALGYDVSDGNVEGLLAIEKYLFSHGVTTFLPTTMSLPYEEIRRVIETVIEIMNSYPDTSVAGVHLEGPYLNPEKRGAQNLANIRCPSESELNDLFSYQKWIRLITIAPEIAGIQELIDRAKVHHIPLSIGHTSAGYAQCILAVSQGINHFTHLFNAMTAIHHRDPGAAGAGMLSDAFVELICDGVHLHPEIVRWVFQTKKEGTVILITDSIRATGMKPGLYTLGGLEVEASEKSARLKDGTLAGSILTMEQAVQNAVAYTGLPLERILRSASCNAAKSVGLKRGVIKDGFPADMAVLNQKGEVISTIKKGKVVFGEAF